MLCIKPNVLGTHYLLFFTILFTLLMLCGSRY